MSLFTDLTNALKNPTTTAVVMQSELEPATGPGGVIAPPTYAADRDGATAKFAYTDEAPIPAADEDGWFRNFVKDGSGQPRRAARVVVNSLAAEAGACETALYYQQQRLGVALPAFIVSGEEAGSDRISTYVAASKQAKDMASDYDRDQLREALSTTVSSWEMAHRQADAWIRYSEEDGEQLWTGTGTTKKIIQSIGLKDGETTFTYSPNSAIYGAWLSSGTPVRQAIPRAYASEINGYGASPVYRSNVKLDAEGGASSSSRLELKNSALSTASGKSGKAPATYGFGQVPGKNHVAGFTFELLLRQASISIKALNRFQYTDTNAASTDKTLAATRVYVLLAMAGHLLSGEDLFLRSGCDLVNVEERWAWRRHGQRQPEQFPVPTLDEVSQALAEALDEANKLGLDFAEPIQLLLSAPEMDLISERMVAEAKNQTTEGD